MKPLNIIELLNNCLSIAKASKYSIDKELDYFSKQNNLNDKVLQAKINQTVRARNLIENLELLQIELEQNLKNTENKLNELQAVCLTHGLRLIEAVNHPLKTLDACDILNAQEEVKIATKPTFDINVLKQMAQSNIKLKLV